MELVNAFPGNRTKTRALQIARYRRDNESSWMLYETTCATDRVRPHNSSNWPAESKNASTVTWRDILPLESRFGTKVNNCCESTAVVNSGICIDHKHLDGHKVTAANPQQGTIICSNKPKLSKNTLVVIFVGNEVVSHWGPARHPWRIA